METKTDANNNATGDATNPTEPVRVQRDIRKVESWEDADRAMGVLRGIDAVLAGIGARHDERIAAMQAEKQKASKALVDRRGRVEKLVTDFADTHRDSLPKGRKSMKLVHGQIGWKKSARRLVFVHSAERTLKLAETRGLDSLIKRTVALDKTACKKLTKGEQTALGVRVTQDEHLYIKLSADPAIEYPEIQPAEVVS